MTTPTNPKPARVPSRGLFWLGTCLFGAIALFFLWEEHEAHIMGALPYVLLLLCPALHLLMHRRHRDHDRGEDYDRGPRHAADEHYGVRP